MTNTCSTARLSVNDSPHLDAVVSGRTVKHALETAGTMKRMQARPVITTEVKRKGK